MNLKYPILALLILGAMPLGALMILPLLLVYLEPKLSHSHPAFVIISYFIFSILLTSFNILIFLALAGSLLFVKYRNFYLFIGLSVLLILSTFIPVAPSYFLLAFFIVGLAMIAMEDSVLSIPWHGKKNKEITFEDETLSKLNAAEEYIKRL